jgi:hypothetical protein
MAVRNDIPWLDRALARRERHRQRPPFIRAVTLAMPLLLIGASVEVFLRFGFLPPFLLPVVIALLALEFVWAARVLAWGLVRLSRLGRIARRFRRRP